MVCPTSSSHLDSSSATADPLLDRASDAENARMDPNHESTMAFGAHWGLSSRSNDFMSMLADLEGLTANNPDFSPVPLSPYHGHGAPQASASVGPYLVHGSHQHQGSQKHPASAPPVSFPNPFLDPMAHEAQSGPGGDAMCGSIAAFRNEAPSYWGPSPRDGFDFNMANNAGDDDGKSVCSSCPDSCPSHCGETGKGSICCDADDCEETDMCVDAACVGEACVDEACVDEACVDEGCVEEVCVDEACVGQDTCVSQACVDQACEGANHPCTDENCFGDGLVPTDTGEEAAAAAALSSFGDMGHLTTAGSFAGGNQFSEFPDGFSFETDPSLAGQNTHHLGFGGLPGTHDNQMANFIMDTAPSTQNNSPVPAWPDMEFFNHILQYHDPSQNHAQHMRPCPVDNPNFMVSKCTLPHPAYQQAGSHGVWSQPSDHQCGFSTENPAMWADHILTQHRTQLSNFPDHTSNVSSPNLNQFFQNIQRNHQAFMGASPRHGLQIPGAQRFPANTRRIPPREISTPVSSGTNASVKTTPLLTPSSPPTPHSFDATLGLEGAVSPKKDADIRSQSQSLGPKNAYQCFWKDPATGDVCLQNFHDSDDLDKHCKEEHTKNLGQVPGGGFLCMWQACKREGDCFPTKAKLNRHLQTHTGFKPMRCDFCGMRLSAKQALDQHKRTHTGECPYECHYGCGKKFKQHSALTMHHRTHSKEKPLRCDICGAVFTESSNLSKHRRTHELRGTFECELCKKDFHRLDQLRRHLSSNHKDQSQEMIDATVNNSIAKAKHLRKANASRVKRERSKKTSARAQKASSPTTSLGTRPTTPESGQESDLDGFMNGVTMGEDYELWESGDVKDTDGLRDDVAFG